jgi:hypothetical protein
MQNSTTIRGRRIRAPCCPQQGSLLYIPRLAFAHNVSHIRESIRPVDCKRAFHRVSVDGLTLVPLPISLSTAFDKYNHSIYLT